MTTNDLGPIEGFESLSAVLGRTKLSDENYETSAVAYVLEAIEEGDELRDEPTVVLCPNCGERVAFYEAGLPAYVCHFESSCSSCSTESLPRWSVVAVDASYGDVFTTDVLGEIVQRYWERHLWRGIETSEGCPRTREFSDLYDEFAERWDWDWRVHCPLCRRSRREIRAKKLDYHHWRRDPDDGILLCRQCHDAIGGGRADMNLDWSARELRLRGKHDLQVTRLAAREALVCEYGSLGQLAERLVERYNLVQSVDEVRCILGQTLSRQSILDEIIDDYLLAGLEVETPDQT